VTGVTLVSGPTLESPAPGVGGLATSGGDVLAIAGTNFAGAYAAALDGVWLVASGDQVGGQHCMWHCVQHCM
jgi:hypothetical protein